MEGQELSSSAHYQPTALPKADPRYSFALAPALQNHLVAIFKELPLLAIRQNQRLCAALCTLQQRSDRFRCCSRYGAGGQQVPWTQIAAVAGVMGQHLCRRPVQIPEIAAADSEWRLFRFAHPRARQPDFQFHVEPAVLSVPLAGEIWQRLRIAFG